MRDCVWRNELELRSEEEATLSPIIKWAGGKENEIKYILPQAPRSFKNYYEPFVGGGSVYASFKFCHGFINDKSEELISLYRCIAQQEKAFFQCLQLIMDSWERMSAYVLKHGELQEAYRQYRRGELSDSGLGSWLLAHVESHWGELSAVLPASFMWQRDVYRRELEKNLVRKLSRMKRIERERHEMPDEDIQDNVETAFKSALYMYYRALYNDKSLAQDFPGLGTALFVFIRNYAYSGMFRYNKHGEFNVPYGGIAYNGKKLEKKFKYYQSPELREHLTQTSISCLDFEDFLHQHAPTADDFVFLDPPYDSEFSTYAQNEFSRSDHERLANYLLHDCKAMWMMVIKNTDFIWSLYADKGLKIGTFDKTYLVSFMNRNDKNAEHLLITNYEAER